MMGEASSPISASWLRCADIKKRLLRLNRATPLFFLVGGRGESLVKEKPTCDFTCDDD